MFILRYHESNNLKERILKVHSKGMYMLLCINYKCYVVPLLILCVLQIPGIVLINVLTNATALTAKTLNI